MNGFYPPAPSLAGHPYWPERLGFLRLLERTRPELARLIQTVRPYTLMTARNLTTLYREGRRTLRGQVPGDFVEIGVHRGGSAAILAAVIAGEAHRELHLFDRWGDLPQPTERDGSKQAEYRRDRIADKLADLRTEPPLELARHLLEGVVAFPRDRLHYYPGWYSSTLGEYPGRPIAFASVDCDYYESVRDALHLVDRFASPGATIVADDYSSWPGARAAVDEWLGTTSRRVRIHALGTGTAVLRLAQ